MAGRLVLGYGYKLIMHKENAMLLDDSSIYAQINKTLGYIYKDMF